MSGYEKNHIRNRPFEAWDNFPMRHAPDRNRRFDFAVPALLAALVLAVYAQAAGFDFVRIDDEEYVVRNPAVQAGLTLDSIRWAFTATRAANWHPLTWLSHMADVTCFGPAPTAPHLVNVALHLANTLLLFALLASMTGARLRSAVVAGLFALHPLHVESVAWVSERKDLLCTFFGFAAIHAHARYAAAPSRLRLAAVAAAAAFSLMAKPMFVTLPFLLVLLDGWPLNRLSSAPGSRLRDRLVEKWPLFGLSLLSCAITVAAQRGAGAVATFRQFPFHARLENALVSVARYLGKTVWPADLCVFYPHPWDIRGSIPAWQPALAAALLVAVTALAVRHRRRLPFLLAGWLWFLGTLVPVLGLVQVGSQAMADRYSYVPLVGLFIAVAWGACEAAGGRPRARQALAALAVVALLGLSALSWRQAAFWKDSETLFARAVQVEPESWVTQQAMGIIRAKQARDADAAAHLRESLRIWPGNSEARRWLAFALGRSGRIDEAIGELRRLAGDEPGDPDAWNNLGYALIEAGRHDEAVAAISKGLQVAPGHERLNANLAEAMRRKAAAGR
jgi:hypothetical protein